MLQVSAAAIREIERLHAKQTPAPLTLRLQVQTGGCAGFIYTLGYGQPAADDHHYSLPDVPGVQIVIDPQTLPWIDDLTLDYSEDLMGGSFRFGVPNTLQQCGCGNSFAA
jgi:iron-sulfur cluster assembly accessory protein